MNKLKSKHIWTLLVLFALAPSAFAQGTVMSDSFGGTAGSALAGTSPDIGSGTWQNTYTGGISYLTGTGAATTASTADGNKTAEARIGISGILPNGITTLEADVSTKNAGWISVGFLQNAPTSSAIWWSSQNVLSLIFNANQSQAYIVVNGAIYESFSALGLNGSNNYHIELSYNADNNFVQAFYTDTTNSLSRTTLYEGIISTFNPSSIEAVGFRIESAKLNTVPVISNMTVTSIPEASSVTAAMGAFALAFLALRHFRSKR